MVSILTLAALAALLALPPGTQPRKTFSMVFPRKVVLTPGTVIVPPAKSGTCSIPLLNALKGDDAQVDRSMPKVTPQITSNMPIVDPPAPPCNGRP
jgi:hypothetical protein